MDELEETAVRVDFYWRPGCGFCSRLHHDLTTAGVELTMHNIWEDPDAAATVRDAARGNETVPTIGIAGRYLVNPRAHAVIDALDEAAADRRS